MAPIDAAQTIAAQMAGWSSSLEDALFGSHDACEIAEMLARYCSGRLGHALSGITFYRRGVGAVFAVTLEDGSTAVIKVHRPAIVGERLEGVLRVQGRLADVGLPAPRPLASPAPLGHGIATAEELLTKGGTANGHDPAIRRTIAESLHAFVVAATPLIRDVHLEMGWPFGLPLERLWPTPHDLRLDFSAPGGGWIDEVAATARQRLRHPFGELVIGHSDWRVENIRFEDERVVAIFDWDSVVISYEPALVGHDAAGFTADRSDPTIEQLPSIEESRSFLLDYQAARGRRITDAEWDTADAAHLYSVAYGARCEHSDVTLGIFPDSGPDQGWRGLLRQRISAALIP